MVSSNRDMRKARRGTKGVESSLTPSLDIEVADGEPSDPFPAGPLDPSLLTSFKTHIAADIWNNKDRDPLRCISKTSTLREWNFEDMENNSIFRGYIRSSGLEPLIRCSYRHCDKIVVSALVERWHPETNTFHLPFGEMSITLDDVSSILGIPVSGRVISPPAHDKDTNEQLLVNCLGVSDQEAKEQLQNESVSLSWLRGRFSKVSDGDSIERNMCSARAYLLYLLGCTLFVDKTGTRVQIVYLRLLRNLDEVAGYSWGSGGLTWLYRQLGQASRSRVKQIGGYLTLLEAWVYEHMHTVFLPHHDLDYLEIHPRACRWSPRRDSGTTSVHVQKYRQRLDALTSDQVIWEPYASAREHHPFPDVAFYSGLLKCCDIVEPYYPERVLRQFGRVQTIPPAPRAPQRGGSGSKSNKVMYDYLEGMWENRENHMLAETNRSVPVRRPSDTVADYLEWYGRVGHPFVQNPRVRAAFDPFASMHTRHYEEHVERMLAITRPIVELGQAHALSTQPTQVFQAVVTLQQILEGFGQTNCGDRKEQPSNSDTDIEAATIQASASQLYDSFPRNQDQQFVTLVPEIVEAEAAPTLPEVVEAEEAPLLLEVVEAETEPPVPEVVEAEAAPPVPEVVEVEAAPPVPEVVEPKTVPEVAEAAPPAFDLSPSIISNSKSEDNPSSPSPTPQIPICWPADGKLSLDWVRNLMSIFDWASKNKEPTQFPDVFPVKVFYSLILSASRILKKEANCVTIDQLGPDNTVVVVGDLHGQLHDMLFLLHHAGLPSENRFFIFNGNYVDIGAWGLESFLILLAWKVLLPENVYLLRGNHESKNCTSVYGFKNEVFTKYGDKGNHVYDKCLGCFKDLPVASIIGKNVYNAHGGLFRSMPVEEKKRKNPEPSSLSPNSKILDPSSLSQGSKSPETSLLSVGSIEELNKAHRSVFDPRQGIIGDVLWSDPSMTPGLSLNEQRGIGLLWGPDCTEDFLKKFQLKLIIRSHEGPDARVKRPGLGRMDEGYSIDHIVESGKLITLFSAPDYPQFQRTEERYGNKGAYIVLEAPDFDNPVFCSFEAITPRPKANAFYDMDEATVFYQEMKAAPMVTSP